MVDGEAPGNWDEEEGEEDGAWVSPAAVAVLVSRLLKLRKTAAMQSWVQEAFAAWAGVATCPENRAAHPAMAWAAAACGRVQDLAATRHSFDAWQRYVTPAVVDLERRRFVRCPPAMQAKAATCQRCTERTRWAASLVDSGQLAEDGTQDPALEALLRGMQEADGPGWESPPRFRDNTAALPLDQRADADGQFQRELAAKLEAMQSRDRKSVV